MTIARRADDVKRVETYFLPDQPSSVRDQGKDHGKLIGDGDLKAGQVDLSVIAGHVVLVGVVNSKDKVDKIIGHARATDGVVSVVPGAPAFRQAGARR